MRLNANEQWKWFTGVSDAGECYMTPYEDDAEDFIERKVHGDKIRVNRPWHGMVHAFRKTALAMDVMEMLLQEDGNDLNGWLRDAILENPRLPAQVLLAALMLRSGRRSEKSDQQVMVAYAERSAEMFRNVAKKYLGSSRLFTCQQEIKDLSEAIRFDIIDIHASEHQHNLSRLLTAAHYCELRRITNFDDKLIQSNIAGHLGLPDRSHRMVKELWSRAGHYLERTGDVDKWVKPGRMQRGDKFFNLSRGVHPLDRVMWVAQTAPFSGKQGFVSPIHSSLHS